MPNVQKSATRVSLSSLRITWKPTKTNNVVVNDPNGNSPSQLHQDFQDEKVPEVYQFKSQDNRVYSDYITMLPTEDIIAQFHKQPHEIHFGGPDYQHYFNEKYEYSAPYPTADHARAIKNEKLVTPQNITTLNIMANLYESQTRSFIFTPTANYDFNKDASHNTTAHVNMLLNALASLARAKIHVRGTLILLVSDPRVCEAINGIWDYSQAYAKAMRFMVDQKISQNFVPLNMILKNDQKRFDTCCAPHPEEYILITLDNLSEFQYTAPKFSPISPGHDLAHAEAYISAQQEGNHTFDQHGKQRQYYKYLGVFFLTSQQNHQMFLLLKNLVNSFFTNLLPLSLSHTELIKLSNIQLIPILAYRLIYNSLPNKLLDTLDHSIWTNIASQGKLSLRTPNKTIYSPRHTLGLGITKISHVTHTQAINHFLRYTSNEGFPTPNHSIQHTLFHRGPASNLLQDMLITSAHHFSIQTHNIPHHNPCQVRWLPLNSAIKVAFLDHNNENSNLWYPGTTIQQNLHSTSVKFSDNIFHLHDTHHFSFITQKGNELSSFITTPTHPICPTTLHDFPIPHTTTLSTTYYFQLKANHNIPLPNFSHLDYWGCHDLLNALQSNTTYSIIYTDGSDDPNSSNPSGSAAIISLQPNNHTIITSPSPLKGSYPAEIYAIIISLLFPQLTTLPQPIISAIDNLSTCLTLNTLLHFHSPPFTTSNNSFALWYNLIWHLLQHLKHITILFTWIKGHADFPGNDAADSVSKWSTTHFDYLLSPTTSTQFAINQTPLPGKITSKLTKHQLPTHQHNNIHLSLSNHFFLKSSWFSTFTFKWVNGLFSCKGYQPHFILNIYLCPLCNHHHPLDPITFITECHTTNAIRKKFFNTWSGHFHNTIITWWATASKGDRRNFIRTLIPNTLSNQLRTPPPNTTYYSNIKSLRQALKNRQKPLTTLLNETKHWLIDDPISNLHQLSPTATSNPWNKSFSI